MIDKEDFITGEVGGSIADDGKSLSHEKGYRYEHGVFRNGKGGKKERSPDRSDCKSPKRSDDEEPGTLDKSVGTGGFRKLE